MSESVKREDLALYGGPKAAGQIEAKAEPKIGVVEFMSLAERFGYSAETLRRIREAISRPDAGGGAFMGRYLSDSKLTASPRFEETAREKFGVRHALAVSSGTAALHAAFAAAGAGPGTEAIVPAIGFMATGAAVVLSGGTPVFCDVDESLTIDPSRIEACITPKTVAIVPTHWGGGVCDMGPILEIARARGLRVVEDCAQAPGARYRGRYVGSMGDVGCFSISCYKIVGCGEGGLVVANDDRLFERACQVAECGGLWRPDRFAPARYPGELFCGANYRLSELEAAVDLIQLQKIDEIVGRYHRAWMGILKRLRTFREIRPQKITDRDGWVGYSLRFYPETHDLSAKIVEALQAEGVGCGSRGPEPGHDWHLYSEMYPIIDRMTPYGPMPAIDRQELARLHYRRGDCPVADDLYGRGVAIGVDPFLTEGDCARVAEAIDKVLGYYCTEDPGAAKWF
jgi:8-amino-3,8-dideoxy-alpha-D-manno-octulosonate transaminase